MGTRIAGRATLVAFVSWGAIVVAWSCWERFAIRPSNYYDEANGIWVINRGGNFLAAAIAELALVPMGVILVVLGAVVLAWKWVQLGPWARLAIIAGCIVIAFASLWLRGLYSPA